MCEGEKAVCNLQVLQILQCKQVGGAFELSTAAC